MPPRLTPEEAASAALVIRTEEYHALALAVARDVRGLLERTALDADAIRARVLAGVMEGCRSGAFASWEPQRQEEAFAVAARVADAMLAEHARIMARFGVGTN